jgi:hypothetical protein
VAEIPITLMYMHLQEQPVPMRSVRRDLPNGLPELVDGLLEKDPGARPADAADVARILAAIGGTVEGAVTENLADRRTLLDRDGDGVGETRFEPGPGPEAYRATALDETRRRPRQVPAAADTEGYRATVLDSGGRDGGGGSGGGGRRGESRGRDEYVGSGERGRSTSRGGSRRADGGPDGWPTVRPRRRSRRLAGVLSSVLTFALVAGIGAYVWRKTHQALQVTAATVSVVHPGKIACNTTVDVVGTISTNGKGGPVTYQWTKDGENLPVGTVTAASGQQQVRVDLKWNLRGVGTHHAVAIFQVFTPNVISAQSASFTYKCAR